MYIVFKYIDMVLNYLFRLISLIFLFVLAVFSLPALAQQYTLYEEDFEGGAYNVTLNNNTNVSVNNGINSWIINDVYNGGITYPNTISQNVTSGGTITDAPQSNYLHIHNSAFASKNANYDNAASSDRMTITTSFCTNGFQDVKLSFFWLGEGEINDYVEIYYSRNGSPWILCPPGSPTNVTRYNSNATLWQEELITDPAFATANELRFGFRWVNDDNGGVNTSSFGVDDISVVANYNGTATITTSIISDSICIGSSGLLGFEVSEKLCSDYYVLERADNAAFVGGAAVDFPYVSSSQTGSGSSSVGISFPAGTTPGCYYYRLSRGDKPFIYGDATVQCVIAYECPVIGVTGAAGGPGPSATLVHGQNPEDTTCRGSIMIMPFLSNGTLNVNNYYVLEGDTSASFSSPLFREIGRIKDANQYPTPLMPGSVGGIIPREWPAGCNYKFRVRSTNPPAIFTIDSNYCIKACPIITNNDDPIDVCVSDFEGVTVTFPYEVDSVDNGVQFFPPQ